MARRFLPNNDMLEAMVDHHVMSLLIQLNPSLAHELYYGVAMVVHSIEIVDTDLLVAHIEHWLVDHENNPLTKPHFCQLDLEIYFADIAFNSYEDGDNEDQDCSEDVHDDFM